MPDFVVLDIVIGLSLIYFFFALVASGITEWLAKVLDKRAKHLREAILNLLQEDNKLVDDLYKNPLMFGLYKEKKNKLNGEKPTPSYIPAKVFATALIDTIDPQNVKSTITQLRDSVSNNTVISKDLQQGLLALIDRAGGDLDQAYKNIEGWFNDSMDRLTGWYKEHTQNVLLVISIIVVLVANVDTLKLVSILQKDPILRAGMVAVAENTVANASSTALPDIASMSEQLEPLKLPIGFAEYGKEIEAYNAYLNSDKVKKDAEKMAKDNGASVASAMSLIGTWAAILGVVSKLTGLFMTALAVQMGAPFWFDMLSKLVNIRNAGKKPKGNKT